MDIGGACLGFLHALAVAEALLESGHARTVLVATGDVHSRTLTPGRVAGEFGGLFGDGASAFLVESGNSRAPSAFALQDFFFGCAVQYQQAIQVRGEPNDRLRVIFDGDALSRAATARLDECVRELEQRSGVRRNQVAAFATHQPNPRLVALVARKIGVPPERFPLVADLHGNLGPTTCAAALHYALERVARRGERAAADFSGFARSGIAVWRRMAASADRPEMSCCEIARREANGTYRAAGLFSYDYTPSETLA